MMQDDDVYRGPCRCSRCLAGRLDDVLELFDDGFVNLGLKYLRMFRFNMALPVDEMECMGPRGQLRVKVKPITREEIQRRKAEAKRRKAFPGLKVVA